MSVIGTGRVIEEVVPVAARLALAKFAQLGNELEVVAPFDVLDDLLLMTPGRSAQQVHQAVGVARDEIHGPVTHPLALHQRVDGLPPATGGFDVADLGAAQHPDAKVFFLRLDAAQGTEQITPDLHQPQRVILGDAQPLQHLELLRHGFGVAQVLDAEQRVQLVPFDLERDQLWNHIIDVGGAGDVHRERLVAVEVIPPPAAGRALHLPALDVDVEHPFEDLGGLTEHDPPDGDDARRQPAQRVDQRPGIGLG